MNRRELFAGTFAVATIGILPSNVFASDGWDMLNEAVEASSRYYLFEFNDDKTRQDVRNNFASFCDRYGFTMKCDEENNTPEIVKNNTFVMQFSKGNVTRTYTHVACDVHIDEIQKGIEIVV